MGLKASAVALRIGVIRFDHVAEEERSPAVRVAELERSVDSPATVLCEDAEQDDEWHAQQSSVRLVRGGDRDREPDRREQGVHEIDGAHEPKLLTDPDPEGDAA